MRVPVHWLRSYCDPGLGAEEIADALTMAGLKLERLHRTGVGDPEAFVVGRVLEAERHPNADRLTVCVVDDGEAEPRTIVCGAPNVAGGQTVAVARPGAVMPDGSRLGEADAPRGPLQRDDPGRGRGRHRRGPHRDHGAGRRRSAGRAAGGPPADRRRRDRDRDHAQPARRDGGVRRGPRPSCGDGRAAGRGPDPPATPSRGARTSPPTTPRWRSPTRTCACASPHGCSRT